METRFNIAFIDTKNSKMARTETFTNQTKTDAIREFKKIFSNDRFSHYKIQTIEKKLLYNYEDLSKEQIKLLELTYKYHGFYSWSWFRSNWKLYVSDRVVEAYSLYKMLSNNCINKLQSNFNDDIPEFVVETKERNGRYHTYKHYYKMTHDEKYRKLNQPEENQ